MHKNRNNNKKYIGITGGVPEYRWSNGNGYKYNSHFYHAIKKYGWNGFEHIILESNLTKREAELREIALIEFNRLTDQDKGYNIAIGGGVLCNKKVYQYDRITGEFINSWENTISIEKQLGIPNTHISAICLGKMKTSHNYYFSYEYLGEKLPKSIFEYINTNNCVRRIAKYNLKGKFIEEFNSLTEATNSFNNGKSTISMKSYTSHGYIWKYIDDTKNYKNDISKKELEKNLNVSKPHSNNKECYQYSLNGKFLNSYSSTTEAAKILKCGQSNIASACRKISANSAGFIWRYADEYTFGKDLEYDDYKHIHKLSKKVKQYDLSGNCIKEFDNISRASEFIGCSTNEISKVCLKKNKTSHGYIWRYSNDPLTEAEIKECTKHNRKRKVVQYDLNMNYIATFESLAEASRKTGTRDTSIQQCCVGKYKHANKYKWKYV